MTESHSVKRPCGCEWEVILILGFLGGLVERTKRMLVLCPCLGRLGKVWYGTRVGFGPLRSYDFFLGTQLSPLKSWDYQFQVSEVSSVLFASTV